MKLAQAVQGVSRTFLSQVARLDGWVNTITGLGGRRDSSTAAHYTRFCRLSDAELEYLYAGNALAAKIVERVVLDALRNGWDTGDAKLAKVLETRDARGLVERARTWSRLFGGSAIVIGHDSPMDSPLPDVTEGSILYLDVVDRREIGVVEKYDDPEDPKYGEPRYYTLGSSSGRAPAYVHESRLILFGGARTTRTMRDMAGGWDLSVLQRPYDALRDTGSAWQSTMHLLQDMSQAVFKIKGLVDMIAEGDKDTMLSRMEIVSMARSVARAVVVDAEGEDYEHVGAANVTGVEPVMMLAFRLVAAASDMPLTVLLGVSPAGLNATGDSDIRLWYDACAQEQRTLTPQVTRLTALLAADAGLKEPDNITWPSLWQPTASEQEDLDTKRANRIKGWLDAGVLDPDSVLEVEFEGTPYALAAETTVDLETPETDETETQADIAPGADIKDPATAYNGAQATALVAIASAVAAGQLPRSVGKGILLAAFPLNDAQAEAILPPEGFVPTPVETPAAPEGAPGAPPTENAEQEPEGDDDGEEEDPEA